MQAACMLTSAAGDATSLHPQQQAMSQARTMAASGCRNSNCWSKVKARAVTTCGVAVRLGGWHGVLRGAQVESNCG